MGTKLFLLCVEPLRVPPVGVGAELDTVRSAWNISMLNSIRRPSNAISPAGLRLNVPKRLSGAEMPAPPMAELIAPTPCRK